MPSLIAASGVFILLSGGWLAVASNQDIERQKRFDRIAGFLIIAGLSCIGVVLSVWFGSPLP